MHRKVMRFLVNFSFVFGIIVSILISSLVQSITDNGGLGVLVFIVSLIIIEMGLASEGMKVEQAENIEKIAYNTEQLLNMQRGMNPGNTYEQTSMLSRAAAEGPITKNTIDYHNPVQKPAQSIETGTWMCKKCLEENAAGSRFCMICGSKKSY